MNASERPPDPGGPRIGSLFSGYGGLDLGVQAVLGGTTAWVSDIDPGACRILAHRYPDVPNLGDITAVKWADVEPVDILTGGFPCQDVSHAGARKGLRPGTRSGLWSRMADAIDHLRPSLVIAENVRGLLSAEAVSDVEPCPWCLGDGSGESPLRALGAVLADLAELGYDTSWYGLRAADVGAAHGRFRVFVLAWPAGSAPDAGSIGRFRGARLIGDRRPAAERVEAGGHAGDEGGARTSAHADGVGRERGGAAAFTGSVGPRKTGQPARSSGASADTHGIGPVRAGGSRDRRDGSADGCGYAVPDATGDGWDEGWPEPARVVGGPDAAFGGDAAPDADGAGGEACGGRPGAGHAGRLQSVVDSGPAWGDYGPAIRRWERRLGRPAPAPTEPGSKGQPRLSPVFVEWLMGLPAGWVTDVPGLSRNDQLKALGNGVVPQQAAAAVRFMLARLAEERRWAA